jgi:7-cyano-7-deazaguanine synthase in queuosine biosynthesis
MLFIIIAEVLAQAIKENPKIEGIKIGNVESKISQYADDSTLFLKDRNSLGNALKLLKEFELVTGLKVNIDKSETFWVGKNIPTDKPFGLKWTQDPKEFRYFYLQRY